MHSPVTFRYLLRSKGARDCLFLYPFDGGDDSLVFVQTAWVTDLPLMKWFNVDSFSANYSYTRRCLKNKIVTLMRFVSYDSAEESYCEACRSYSTSLKVTKILSVSELEATEVSSLCHTAASYQLSPQSMCRHDKKSCIC